MNGTPQPNEARGEDPTHASPWFWFLVVVTGATSGLASVGLLKLLKAVQHLAWSYSQGQMFDAVARVPAWRRVLTLALAGLIVAVGKRLIKSTTAGHGGGLNETIWFHAGRMPFVPTVARAILSIVGVGMGISLGREGALKQTGAALASLFTRLRSVSPARRRLLSACGASAGIAAAYNVPFGGALFGLEVLLGTFSVELALPLLVSSLIAAGIARVLILPHPTYQIPVYSPTLAHALFAFFAGPLFGVVAMVYVRWIGFMDALKPKGLLQLVSPLVATVALGLVAIELPQLLGNGKDEVHAALLGTVPLGLAVALALLKPIATGTCLGAGIPGGLFTPTLCFGALTGSAFGVAMHALWPAAPQASFALIGMTALLAGATHGPISSLVLASELTANAKLAIPMMLASAGAVVTARLLDARSMYTARLHRRMAESMAMPRPAAHAQRTVLSSATRFSVLTARLALAGPKPPPLIVDEEGRVIGEVSLDRVAAAMHGDSPLGNVTARDVIQPMAPAG